MIAKVNLPFHRSDLSSILRMGFSTEALCDSAAAILASSFRPISANHSFAVLSEKYRLVISTISFSGNGLNLITSLI